MNITQVFKSSADSEVISELEIGAGDQATPISIEGDNVHWFAKDKALSRPRHVPTHFVQYA